MSDYQRGLVAELDTKGHRARVRLPARENMLTGWLDVLVRDAHTDKDYGLPSVGAQVAVMLDERAESGCVLGALYSDEDTTPVDSATKRRMHFGDGAYVEYDRDSHVFKLYVPSGGVVQVADGGSGDGVVRVGDSISLGEFLWDATTKILYRSPPGLPVTNYAPFLNLQAPAVVGFAANPASPVAPNPGTPGTPWTGKTTSGSSKLRSG